MMLRFSVILALFLAAPSLKAAAQEDALLYTGQVKELTNIPIFIDKDGALDVHQAIHEKFTPSNNNLGITRHVIWFKIGITNRSKSGLLFLEIKNPLLEEISFYLVRNNEIKNTMIMGQRYGYSQRLVPSNPNYVYPIPLGADSSATVLVRIRSNTPIHLPVYIGSAEKLTNQVLGEMMVMGLYCGIVLVMFLYNFFIFLFAKDKSYLYYIVYILFVGITQLVISGYAAKFFWPHSPWLSLHGFMIIGTFSGIATGLFAQSFLHTKFFAPRLNVLINVIIGLYIAALALYLLGARYFALNMANALAVVGSILILFTGITIARQSFAPAKYFLWGFTIFLISVIVYVLRSMSLIRYNDFTAHVLEFGSAAQITLLSLALADKISTYRKERSAARQEALYISLENERLVTEQNLILESLVHSRTAELEASNRNLSETLQQLKTAQTKLVDSEKMASLGQLTAGVAHEINNPINFVTANVKPLELDIRELLVLFEKYQQIDPANNIAQQLQEIETYKQQIDIPYIGTEIQFLLNGIKEGASRTAEIVRNLKSFSRVDQSNVKYVNLNEGLDSTLLLVRNTFPASMKLEKFFGALPRVECVPGKINQVFMNIITNAVQAMKSKAYHSPETPVLMLRTWSEDEYVKICFKDNGTGMTPQVQAKIFEPFFTTKDVGEGIGLGMSIVKGVVDSHHGQLEINSTPGNGTEFILTLPIQSPQQ